MKSIKLFLSPCLAAFLFCTPVKGHAKSTFSLDEQVRKAPLIFEGEVVKIEYKNSASSQQNPKGLPHTFVTYKVINQVFGKTEGFFTLRFFGGSYADGIVMEVNHYPTFDVGEHDVLLVNGNTELGCPLMSCTEGRFRIANGKVFSDEGRVIRKGAANGKSLFSFGSYQDLSEANSHTFVHPKTGKEATITTKGESPKAEAPEADQLALADFINALKKIKQGQTPGNLVPSANIGNEIKAIVFTAVAPPSAPPAKVIPPKDQEEITEQKRLEANGGNPVL